MKKMPEVSHPIPVELDGERRAFAANPAYDFCLWEKRYRKRYWNGDYYYRILPEEKRFISKILCHRIRKSSGCGVKCIVLIDYGAKGLEGSCTRGMMWQVADLGNAACQLIFNIKNRATQATLEGGWLICASQDWVAQDCSVESREQEKASI